MAMTNLLRLKPAFSDDQIERPAALFDEQLTTKADLEALRIATKGDTDALGIRLTNELDKLRLETQRDAKGMEARLIAWVVGQGAATIGILFALLHFTGK